ncbi:hypothetical protein FRC96_07735 [Lujinxingia vulgaris]|uniref:Uncharacterized protein n=1 Tax=Lujinxingia vulgaris TaxID=2600176 RepID=A0A5C6XC19_9DELT|nr:hypothetical protein [Lujinxingia vulgaris]TXD37998.1 hypothetical protein FRC96_07735 [Lujinxingia vulgaris]
MRMWMGRWMAVLVLASGLGLAGCSSDPEEGSEDVGVEDTTEQPDADRDADVQPGEPVGFVIRNAGESTIYVQDNSYADYGLAWLEVRFGGEPLSLSDTCMPCGCGDPEPCGVCDAPMPSVIALAPGEEVRHEWEGIYYRVDRAQEPVCTQASSVGEASFSAELCYATALDAEEENLISGEDTVCQSFEAALGDEDVVLVAGER